MCKVKICPVKQKRILGREVTQTPGCLWLKVYFFSLGRNVCCCVCHNSKQLKAFCAHIERERGQQTPTNSNCFRSIAVLPLCAIMCLMSSHLIYRCPPTYTGCFVLSTLNVCNYYTLLLFFCQKAAIAPL